jgi:hypothetical protein
VWSAVWKSQAASEAMLLMAMVSRNFFVRALQFYFLDIKRMGACLAGVLAFAVILAGPGLSSCVN